MNHNKHTILKSVFGFLLILIIACGAFYINVMYSEYSHLSSKVSDTQVSPQDTVTVVSSTVSNIIRRDGNVPIEVAKKYTNWVFDAAAKHNVDPILLLSIMAIESKFDYKAVSPGGQLGLFQIAYTFHKEKSTRAALFDPHTNIEVGARILSEYKKRSSTETETLLRYNGSLGSAPIYATKVLNKKVKINREIMDAILKDI